MKATVAPLVVVGDALLDVDVVGTVDRLAPDAPVPVLSQATEFRRPGGAALAAALAARGGRPVVLITPLAEDQPAAELRRLLPAERVVEAGGARIAMVHDAGPRAGRLARMRRRFGEQAAAVVFGHSHLPLHEQAADGFQIFNPGSPTERRRAPAHTMGMATVERGVVEFELFELTPYT